MSCLIFFIKISNLHLVLISRKHAMTKKTSSAASEWPVRTKGTITDR